MSPFNSTAALKAPADLPRDSADAGQISRNSASPPIGPELPWLAPLAGYTELSFRLLCRELGAAAACTEMISAKGLIYGLRGRKRPDKSDLFLPSLGLHPLPEPQNDARSLSGTEELLQTCPEDDPLIIQLFGAEPDFISQSVDILREWGFTWFDLNMGCSVPKVVKTGAGAAMLKDIPNALAVAKAMIKAAGPGKAGFKLRLGWDHASCVYLDLSRELEELGAAWVTLHPRFARQGFQGQADWQAIAALKRSLGIPVVASGDLFTAEDGRACLDQTNADGVMFARGAITNPAIFTRFLNPGDAHPPTAQDLRNLLNRHITLARAYVKGVQPRTGLPRSLVMMRTFAPRYVKHLPGVRHLRPALAACDTWPALLSAIEQFFRAQPPEAGEMEPASLLS